MEDFQAKSAFCRSSDIDKCDPTHYTCLKVYIFATPGKPGDATLSGLRKAASSSRMSNDPIRE